MTQRVQRISAYGVARDEIRVLLVRLGFDAHGDAGKWTLPGGGVEHGEHPADTVVREFAEETGLQVQVERLLDVGSDHRLLSGHVDFHGVFALYAVTVIGGTTRDEIDGPMRTPTWVNTDQLDQWPLLGPVRAALNRLARPEHPVVDH